MADRDPIEEGLRKTEAELENRRERWTPPQQAPEDPRRPEGPFNSDAARDLGAVLGEVLGRGAISWVRSVVDGRDHPPGPRPRSRFTSPTPRTPAVVAVTPPPAPSAHP